MKRRLARLLEADTGSALRALIRAVILLLAAFGLQLSGDQIAGIMLVVEAVLQLAVQLTVGHPPAPPPTG